MPANRSLTVAAPIRAGLRWDSGRAAGADHEAAQAVPVQSLPATRPEVALERLQEVAPAEDRCGAAAGAEGGPEGGVEVEEDGLAELGFEGSDGVDGDPEAAG